MDKQNWIIGICCTEADGVSIIRVNGTKDQVKQYLVDMAVNDMLNEYESIEDAIEEYGCWCTTKPEDVEETDGGKELNAYGTYSDYHIDYTARLEDAVKIEKLN